MQSALDTLVAIAAGQYDIDITDDKPVVRVIGFDAPYELIRAAGLHPIRLVANSNIATPLADALVGAENMSQRGRSLLQQLLADEQNLPVLITHSDYEQSQLFAALRDLIRTKDIAARELHFFDLLHMPRESTQRYNTERLDQCAQWLSGLPGANLSAQTWQYTLQHYEQSIALLKEANVRRTAQPAELSGVEFAALQISFFLLDSKQWYDLAKQALASLSPRSNTIKRRVIIAGAPQYGLSNYQTLQDAGYQVVGDYQDWGDSFISYPALPKDNWQALAKPDRIRPGMLVPPPEKITHLTDLYNKAQAEGVIYLITSEDEPSAWDYQKVTAALQRNGIPAGIWQTGEQLPSDERLFAEVNVSLASVKTEVAEIKVSRPNTKPKAKPQRSKKALKSIANFGSYQREWFQQVREKVAQGAPFAMVNANAPQEILRAMEIPFVVNQWWASIVAAKQQSSRYFRLLEHQGYPVNVESYSAQGLAAWYDDEPEQAPWGGLPKPNLVQAVLSSDATPRIFQYWSQVADATLFLYERSIESRQQVREDWWQTLPSQWEQEIEPCRLDLMVSEMEESIAQITRVTGRWFDKQKFRDIMHLVNEQEHFYRKTRDLIASAHPAPVGVADTMPATMVPQWHRGTEWARDAAKAFYEEVKAKVDAGDSVCENERLRLMWIGRGMWSDMSFYQRWQDSHGAVFVWSMYLALAADGYIREFGPDQDPMRALAARFITMGDELRMPTWAGAWYVNEAKTHGVHGAIALSDADPFVLRSLERAGVPVLALAQDNYHQSEQARKDNDKQISAFLDELMRNL